MTSATESHAKPWYRERLVWLLIAPPAVAIAVGMTMLYLAIVSSDGLVVDDYYRHGKAINQVLKRDEAARHYAERGELTIAANAATLRLQGTAATQTELTLKFLHVTRAVHDVTLTLARTSDGQYRATLPPLPPGRWYVQLEGADWRLLGSLVLPHDRRIALTPP